MLYATYIVANKQLLQYIEIQFIMLIYQLPGICFYFRTYTVHICTYTVQYVFPITSEKPLSSEQNHPPRLPSIRNGPYMNNNKYIVSFSTIAVV